MTSNDEIEAQLDRVDKPEVNQLSPQPIKYSVWNDRVDYYFDRRAAYNVVRFFENEIQHIKGPLAGQKLKLERWQRRFLRRLYGWKRRSDNTRRYRTVFLFLPRKQGKALALDTKIPTPKGWKTMGQLKVGDFVYDENGLPTKVVDATEILQQRQCFEVLFSDHTRVICDADHEWLVNDRSLEKPKVMSTKDMIGRVKMSKRAGFNKSNLSIPVAKAVCGSNLNLPIEPYVLGLWLGDGCSSSPLITVSKKDCNEISKEIKTPHKIRRDTSGNMLLVFTGKIGGGRKSKARVFRDDLVDLDLIKNKHIPELYLKADIHSRMELLRGLMDSDGHCTENGNCEFVNTNLKLSQQTLELVKSLGFKPVMEVGKAKLNGKIISDKYRVLFRAYKENPIFKLDRKIQRLKSTPKTRQKSGTRQIISITKVDSVPVRCIQVENPTSLYLCSESFIPTHNSFLGAGMAIYGLVADGEQGAECVSAAVDRDQARVIFDVAKEIIVRNPRLSKICTVYAKTIVVHKTASKYSVLSADVENKHGSNPSTIIFDELHTQPNGNLVEVLETGTGARAQPLIAFFTTAGHDQNSVCYEYYQKAKAVERDPSLDPSFLPVIYEAKEDKNNPDYWKDPAVWKQANPNYGISINPINFEIAFRKALENKRLENGFKRLYLNCWTNQEERWIPMDQWAEGSEPFFSDEMLQEMSCVGGLDLSSKSDLTAFLLVFRDNDGIHYIKPYFWLPKDNIDKKERADRVPYRDWARQGFIDLLPGDIIDYAYIRKTINKLSEKFRIYQIGYDPHRAEQLAVQLEQDGFDMIEVRQGYAKLSEPCKELESLLEASKIKHNGNPILYWMASNVAVETNSYGEIRPDKKRKNQRIDGISALINALSRLIVYSGKKRSKYEDEGLETT